VEVATVLKLEAFVRVKQAAALLGVSPNTVRTWGAAGKIPEHRHPVNNYRLYKRADLEKVMRRSEESATDLLPRESKASPR
jgi:excisionase family DNA binding protein